MRLTRALIAVPALALGLAACGDSDSPAEAGSSLVATWDVRSIEGQTLPITETEDFEGVTCSITISAMHLTFTNAGRYTGNATGSFTCTGMTPQTFNEPSAGTYRVSGNTLFMTRDPDDDGTFEEERSTFSISGRTLTITSDDGTTIVLERR